MRVAVVSHACVVDRNQELWLRLAEDFGHEVRVYAPLRWRALDGRWLELSVLPGMEERVEGVPVWFSGAVAYHVWRGVERRFRGWRPDLIWLDEEPYGIAAWQAMRAADAVGCRLVFWMNQNIARGYPPPFSWIERRMLRRADAAAVVCRGAEEVLRAKGCRLPVYLVPYWVDVERFAAADRRVVRELLGLEGFVIGFVGRLVESKGVDLLLRAAAEVLRQGDVRVLIVGEGPQRGELEELGRRLLGERAVFAGAVPHGEVADYVAAMDVLVLPSRTTKGWKEQFGRVLIEALAAGVPVIGSDSGAIPEVIESAAGLIFREGDWRDLAERIRQLMEDSELAREIAEKGRERVRERYSVGAVARRVDEVLAAVCGG